MESLRQNRHFKSRLLSIVSSILPTRKRGRGWKREKKKQVIKSDYIVSLIEQFASQFCQHCVLTKNSHEHNECRLPNHQASFILPLMPFKLYHRDCGYIYNLSICLSHTHTLVYDDGYFSAEWRVGSKEGHLVPGVLAGLLCLLSVNSGSRQSASSEALLSKKSNH